MSLPSDFNAALMLYINPELSALSNITTVEEARDYYLNDPNGSNLEYTLCNIPDIFDSRIYLADNKDGLNISGFNQLIKTAMVNYGYSLLDLEKIAQYVPSVYQDIYLVAPNVFAYKDLDYVVTESNLNVGDEIKIAVNSNQDEIFSVVTSIDEMTNTFTVSNVWSAPLSNSENYYLFVGQKLWDTDRIAKVNFLRGLHSLTPIYGDFSNRFYGLDPDFNVPLYKLLYPDAKLFTPEQCILDYTSRRNNNDIRIGKQDEIVKSISYIYTELKNLHVTCNLKIDHNFVLNGYWVNGITSNSERTSSNAFDTLLITEKGSKAYLEMYMNTTMVLNQLVVNSNATFSNAVIGYGQYSLSNNLLMTGSAFVGCNVSLSNDLYVGGNFQLAGQFHLLGDEIIDGHLYVKKDSYFGSNVSLSNDLYVFGNTYLWANATVSNDLNIHGNTYLWSNVNVGCNATISNDLSVNRNAFVQSNATISNTLTVQANAYFLSNTNCCNNTIIAGNTYISQSIYAGSNVSLSNDLTVFGNTYMWHNATLSNDLNIHGNSFLWSNLSVGSNISLSNDLTVFGNAYIWNNATVSNDLQIHGNTYLWSNANIGSNVAISNDLDVFNNTRLHQNVNIGSNLAMSNDLDTYGNARIYKSLNVASNISLSNDLTVFGNTYMWHNATVSNDLQIHGNTYLWSNANIGSNAAISNDLEVYGNTRLHQNVNIGSNLAMSNDLDTYGSARIYKSLNVASNISLSNDLTVFGNTYMWHNATVSNDLQIHGNTYLWSNANIGSNATISNDLDVFNNTRLHQNVNIGSNLAMSNDLDTYGNARIYKSLNVASNISLSNDLTAFGNTYMWHNATVSNDLQIHGNTYLWSNVSVGCNVAVSNSVTVGGSCSISNVLNVLGTATFGTSTSYGSLVVDVLGAIRSDDYLMTSDVRVKRNVQYMDNDYCSDFVRNVDVISYHLDYDPKKQTKYGFVAQDIERHDPQIVKKTTGYIPNISAYTYVEGDKITLKDHNLNIGDRIKVIRSDGSQSTIVVNHIDDSDSFRINTTTFDRQRIYLYGSEQPDFRIVDYSQLVALQMGALRQALKRIDDLENQLSNHRTGMI